MIASSVASRRRSERRGPVSNEATVPSAPSMSPTWARSRTERRSAGGVKVGCDDAHRSLTRQRRRRRLAAASLRRPVCARCADMADRLVEQRRDVLVVQRVEALASVALGHDQPMLAQDAQLVGDRRLLHADRRHQLADRVRPLRSRLRIRTRLGVERANIASATFSPLHGTRRLAAGAMAGRRQHSAEHPHGSVATDPLVHAGVPVHERPGRSSDGERRLTQPRRIVRRVATAVAPGRSPAAVRSQPTHECAIIWARRRLRTSRRTRRSTKAR